MASAVDVNNETEFLSAISGMTGDLEVNFTTGGTYDLSLSLIDVLTIDAGNITFTVAKGVSSVDFILGQYGFKFIGHSVTYNGGIAFTFTRSDSSTSNHILSFDDDGNAVELNISNWIADGDSVNNGDADAWNFVGNGHSTANLTDCKGINCINGSSSGENDGFGAEGYWTINLFGDSSEASNCDGEAISPHDAATINVYAGMYISGGATNANCVGLGNGLSSTAYPTVNIRGGSFTGDNPLTMFDAGGAYGRINIYAADTIYVEGGGDMFRLQDNCRIYIAPDVTIGIGSGSWLGDNDNPMPGSVFIAWKANFDTPSFSTTQMCEGMAETANFSECTFDLRGTTINNSLFMCETGKTMNFWDCDFIGGDIGLGAAATHCIDARTGTINMRRCNWDLNREWQTFTTNRALMGVSAGGEFNAEGCQVWGFNNAAADGSEMTVFEFNGSGNTGSIIHCLIYNDSGVAHTATTNGRGIVVDQGAPALYGNLIWGTSGEYIRRGIEYASAGAYTEANGCGNNWVIGCSEYHLLNATAQTGDIIDSGEPTFTNPTPATIEDAIAGFLQTQDENRGSVAGDAYVQSTKYSPAELWTPSNLTPSRRKGPLDYGAVSYPLGSSYRNAYDRLNARRSSLRHSLRRLHVGV